MTIGQDRQRGDEGRHAQQGEQQRQAQPEAEHRTTDERAEDSAETTDAQHPVHPRGAEIRWVVTGRKGVETGLRTAHAETCRRHAECQKARLQAESPQQQDERAAQCIGGRNDGVGITSVHGPTDQDRADRAADLEQAGDGRCAFDGQATFAQQRRHPAHGQVDHQQAHEIGQPERQGAGPIALGEQHAHRCLVLGLGFGEGEVCICREFAPKLVQYFGDLGGWCIARCQETCGLRQQQPEERQQHHWQNATGQQYRFPAVQGNQPGCQ
ncbi:hypothetical protein D9M71_337730 [compost metagenome]